MANALKRVGLSWWREGLGGGVVPPAPPSQSHNDAEIARVAALTEHFTRIVALDPSRPAVLRGPRVEPYSRAAEFQYRGPDLTRTLPADLKARLVIFYLDPRSFAALACTCRAWHALSVGPDSLWRDKLSVLEALWPDCGLPSDEGIVTYYRVGGRDPTAWARRYARAQAIAPKLSATACTCAGAEQFRTRLFTNGRGDEEGACQLAWACSTAARHAERAKRARLAYIITATKTHTEASPCAPASHWDLLPGTRSGSPFPTVALCRSMDAGFDVTGSKALQPGTYLIRWRVRSARARAGTRPPLTLTAMATTVALQKRADAAVSATSTAASTAAGLAATALAITAVGVAGPIVLGVGIAASVAAGGAVAASVAHNAMGAVPDVPCLLLPAPNPMFDTQAAQQAAAALVEARSRGPLGDTVQNQPARSSDVPSSTLFGMEGTWRLDLEGHLTGWRYVHVAIAQVGTPCLIKVGISGARHPGTVSGLAIDYVEFVPLHDDAFRLDGAVEPVDVPEPALVDYNVARQLEAMTLERGTL